ncbi:hypothetical protein BDK51DRAFT_41130 [Blyttiomyces helicus]|uniref:Uncharacterized protein n=1 Tax=Blyttiomyces helicus TaxID=388810 RepID=A0A4P9W9Z2_9FUNG|nr:hypothetical protein BDK51DRAFT_41130 [Blyttiomyces helicus]|eukprot:RKO88345.1 hypothetical protein BDK51DRAFT_41130 [Blyttiomyces helicus]
MPTTYLRIAVTPHRQGSLPGYDGDRRVEWSIAEDALSASEAQRKTRDALRVLRNFWEEAAPEGLRFKEFARTVLADPSGPPQRPPTPDETGEAPLVPPGPVDVCLVDSVDPLAEKLVRHPTVLPAFLSDLRDWDSFRLLLRRHGGEVPFEPETAAIAASAASAAASAAEGFPSSAARAGSPDSGAAAAAAAATEALTVRESQWALERDVLRSELRVVGEKMRSLVVAITESADSVDRLTATSEASLPAATSTEAAEAADVSSASSASSAGTVENASTPSSTPPPPSPPVEEPKEKKSVRWDEVVIQREVTREANGPSNSAWASAGRSAEADWEDEDWLDEISRHRDDLARLDEEMGDDSAIGYSDEDEEDDEDYEEYEGDETEESGAEESGAEEEGSAGNNVAGRRIEAEEDLLEKTLEATVHPALEDDVEIAIAPSTTEPTPSPAEVAPELAPSNPETVIHDADTESESGSENADDVEDDEDPVTTTSRLERLLALPDVANSKPKSKPDSEPTTPAVSSPIAKLEALLATSAAADIVIKRGVKPLAAVSDATPMTLDDIAGPAVDQTPVSLDTASADPTFEVGAINVRVPPGRRARPASADLTDRQLSVILDGDFEPVPIASGRRRRAQPDSAPALDPAPAPTSAAAEHYSESEQKAEPSHAKPHSTVVDAIAEIDAKVAEVTVEAPPSTSALEPIVLIASGRRRRPAPASESSLAPAAVEAAIAPALAEKEEVRIPPIVPPKDELTIDAPAEPVSEPAQPLTVPLVATVAAPIVAVPIMAPIDTAVTATPTAFVTPISAIAAARRPPHSSLTSRPGSLPLPPTPAAISISAHIASQMAGKDAAAAVAVPDLRPAADTASVPVFPTVVEAALAAAGAPASSSSAAAITAPIPAAATLDFPPNRPSSSPSLPSTADPEGRPKSVFKRVWKKVSNEILRKGSVKTGPAAGAPK